MIMPDMHKIYELKSQISIQFKKSSFYISLDAVKLQIQCLLDEPSHNRELAWKDSAAPWQLVPRQRQQ